MAVHAAEEDAAVGGGGHAAHDHIVRGEAVQRQRLQGHLPQGVPMRIRATAYPQQHHLHIVVMSGHGVLLGNHGLNHDFASLLGGYMTVFPLPLLSSQS